MKRKLVKFLCLLIPVSSLRRTIRAKLINELVLGYKFYVRPNFIDQTEVVLYATVK